LGIEIIRDVCYNNQALSREAEQGRTNRGVSGALNLQSAIAGMMPTPGFMMCRQPQAEGDEEPVLRNAKL